MDWIRTHWFQLLPMVLLVLAFGAWPYGYYQLVRWVVCIAGAYCAYKTYESNQTGWALAFAATAILFNPIAPFYMQQDTWQVLDLIAACIFGVSTVKAKFE